MTNYTITENCEYNSREVYFDAKPANPAAPALPGELSDLYTIGA